MSLDVLGVSCVGAGASKVIITAPYHVLVSPHAVGVVEFGSQFGKGQSSPIDRVVVTGGRAGAPVWDKEDTIFDAPDKVEVYLRGVSQPQVFTAGQGDFAGGIKMAYVAGGARVKPSTWGRSRGNLRVVGADAASSPKALGYTDETRVARVQRAIYNLPQDKQDSEFQPLLYDLQQGDKAWGVFGPTTQRALNRFNFLYAKNDGPIITDNTLYAAESFFGTQKGILTSALDAITKAKNAVAVAAKNTFDAVTPADKAAAQTQAVQAQQQAVQAQQQAATTGNPDVKAAAATTQAAAQKTVTAAGPAATAEQKKDAVDEVKKVDDKIEKAKETSASGKGIAATWARASTWQKVAVVGLGVFGVSAVSLGVWGIARGGK